MSYTASGAISRICLKAWTSTSRSLTDAQLLELLDDSLRTYVVPFLKSVRDEWFVSGSESVSPDSDGIIAMPNSVASTVRIVEWMNNNQPTPLVRVEPERAYLYEGQSGGGMPGGYMLQGYGIKILPTNVGSVTVRIRFMERPADMVLEEDAAEIESHSSLVLTLGSVPLAWQSSTPATVDIISSESPFSAVAEDVTVVSLVGTTLTLSGISASLVEDGFWVADVGTNPYPNLPIELHPLLQLDVMRTLFEGLGDKRLDGITKRQQKMEMELHKTLVPRTQGNPRPILNPSAPGVGMGGFWYGR